MGNKRRTAVYLVYMLLGALLLVLRFAGVVDDFWGGMGTALIFVACLRLVQIYRFRNNDTYREMVETETADERNRFIRSKAWAWAGYLFVLIMGVSVFILKLADQELMSMAASCALCLLLLLYYGAYFVLRKKY